MMIAQRRTIDITKRLSQFSEELQRTRDPVAAKRRRDREQRKLAWLRAAGLLPEKATKKQIAAAWRLYSPGAQPQPSPTTSNSIDFNDDLPF